MTTRIGMLTPSSNTALEPATYRLLRALPDVGAHLARFPVTEIALSPGALAQFEPEPILAAADLLAHAKVDVIAWNGTSASWLGFERDETLAKAVTARTGIPATTAILALNTLVRGMNARRLGIVTPYTGDVQARIVANFEAAGIECATERHAGLSDNFAFAALPPAAIEAMIMEASAAQPDAIARVACADEANFCVRRGLGRKIGREKQLTVFAFSIPLEGHRSAFRFAAFLDAALIGKALRFF